MKKKDLKVIISLLIVTIGIIIGTISFASHDIVVALDPGHGGTEIGAVGGDLVEKNLNWKIATKVKEILDNTPGITGVLTKNENETLNREVRARRAKNNGADLLVSFHINSNELSDRLSGAEVYVTCNTTQKRYYEYSNILGTNILNNLRDVGVSLFAYKPLVRVGEPNDFYPDGTIADYYGIISWPMHFDIPSVLVEHCFINNPSDRERYLNDAMLDRMAEADARAIIANKELFRREYYGTINTELNSIDLIQSSNGTNYIGGYIYIAEWVGIDCRKPDEMPKITLKSTDGKISTEMYVGYEDGIKYYFDKNIEGIDLNKEYYIEVELTGRKNIAPEESKKQTIRLPNKIIRQNYKDRILKTINNKIVFSEGEYKGNILTEVIETKLVKSVAGDTYIGGFVNIDEVIENTRRNPRTMPEIWIKSTDGTICEKAYIGYEYENRYYYDKHIENYDRMKTYYIEAKLVSEDNVESEENKKQILQIENGEIGKNNGLTITAKNNKFNITYEGRINTELSKMNMIQNSAGDNYISGFIYIAEWVNGECRQPITMPQITLKSTDGDFEELTYINHENGIQYYFDKNIEKLDTSKEYYLEVKLTDSTNNASEENKKQEAKFSIQGVNEILNNGMKVQIVNGNHLKIVDPNLYYGNINTELSKMNIIQNSAGDNYISGFIYIAEWVNGECRQPITMPQITLKSTDGDFEELTYINHENGIQYYFDKNIEKLDTSKEYYLEVKLTNNKNLSSEDKKTQIAKITPQGKIGIFTNGNEVIVTENNINIQEYKYHGEINTELSKMQIIQKEKGENYISGFIYIAEWVNGECRVPSETPQIKLKATDGSYETTTYINRESGIEYYFDKNIEGLDTSKTYYLEVKLTSKQNIATEIAKTQTAKITPQGQIGICTNGNEVIVTGNNINIQEYKYYGEINTELSKMQIIQNEKGENYISGFIYIAEWVNGECRVPSETPQIKLKATDGSYETTTYINRESGIEYYFDKNIEGLDTSKTYYLEVKLTSKQNIATEIAKTQTARITPQGQIGICTNENKIIVTGNYIKIQKKIENKILLQNVNIKQEEINEDNQIVKETNVETEQEESVKNNKITENDIGEKEKKEENIIEENIEKKEGVLK